MSRYIIPAITLLAFLLLSSFFFVAVHDDEVLDAGLEVRSEEMVRVGLAFRPSLNRKRPETGKTPLITIADLAEEHPGDSSIPRLAAMVLDAGADPNVPDSEGWTPLMVAGSSGSVPLVELLIQRGAQVNRKAKAGTSLDGMTPLMAASHRGNNQIVELLIQNGAEVEALSSTGMTALLVAASQGHESTVQVLVQHGAKVTDEEVTAARAYPYPRVMDTLLKALGRNVASPVPSGGILRRPRIEE